MKNYKRLTVILLLVAVGAYVLRLEHSDDGCKKSDYFLKLALLAVVSDKYYDHENHAVPVVEFVQLEDTSRRTVSFHLELSGTFELLQKGDTVLKEKNSHKLFVISNGVKSLLRELKFECN